MSKKSKQDLGTPRTIEQLCRKYNFAGMLKAIQQSTKELFKTKGEMTNFVNQTVGSLENIQNQIDGKVDTYYYSGVPSLFNEPAVLWDEKEYEQHVGDLYYDKDTGSAYRFVYKDGQFFWDKTESGIAEALAVANAAKDTADSKRRIFVREPVPPYDEGDLWLNNKEIYVCYTAKASGEFKEEDFGTATDYVDNDALDKMKKDMKDTFVQLDRVNINEAWVKDLLVHGKFLAEDMNSVTGSFSGYLAGVKIIGDLIEANTLKADTFILKGEDGLYRRLNIDALGEVTVDKDKKYSEGIDGSVLVKESVTATQINVKDLFAQEITATGSVTGLKFISRGRDDYGYAAEMVLDAGELHLVAGDGLLDDGTYAYAFNADISAHDIELSYKAPDVLNRLWLNGNLIEHIVGDDSGNRTTVFKSSPDGVEVTSIDISEGITGTKERPLYNGKPLALYSDLN